MSDTKHIFRPGELAHLEALVRRLEIVSEKTSEALRMAKSTIETADQISRSQTQPTKPKTRTP